MEEKLSEKEIFEYAKELMRCAENDFISAKTIYNSENKIYSTILYHIQQSVEKLAKAELVLRKQLDIRELKKVNHRTPNAFMISLDKAKQDNVISPFIKQYIDEDALKKAQGYVLNPEEIMQSKKEVLLQMLNYYEVFKQSGVADAIQLHALFSPIADRVKEDQEEKREAYMNLFFMSWITFFHAEMTRYPDGKIKPWQYDENNAFVQIIPDFFNKIERTLKIMQGYKLKSEEGLQ